MILKAFNYNLRGLSTWVKNWAFLMNMQIVREIVKCRQPSTIPMQLAWIYSQKKLLPHRPWWFNHNLLGMEAPHALLRINQRVRSTSTRWPPQRIQVAFWKGELPPPLSTLSASMRPIRPRENIRWRQRAVIRGRSLRRLRRHRMGLRIQIMSHLLVTKASTMAYLRRVSWRTATVMEVQIRASQKGKVKTQPSAACRFKARGHQESTLAVWVAVSLPIRDRRAAGGSPAVYPISRHPLRKLILPFNHKARII